jgi:thiosulfate dehydrogenase [quinone] large subunit
LSDFQRPVADAISLSLFRRTANNRRLGGLLVDMPGRQRDNVPTVLGLVHQRLGCRASRFFSQRVARRFPLAAVHNQINPLTKFFMILLRVAIGWHLLYEGCTKINAGIEGKKPFSAEMYLRYSTGPLRFYFRSLVDDFHGLELLDADAVSTRWSDYVAGVPGLDEPARSELAEIRTKLEADLRSHLQDSKDAIDRYRSAIQEFEDREQRALPGFGASADGDKPKPSDVLGDAAGGKLLKPALQPFEWDYQKKLQKDLDKTRGELTGPVMKWSDDLVAAVRTELTAARVASAQSSGELTAASATADAPKMEWKPELQKINLTTMWGLTICGGLMIVGLFTRSACLGGAILLTLFYLAMPPWPGLDPAPIAEGSYLIVNKTLIEIFALLMLATSPVGVWGGLDSLIRGWITRPMVGVGKREVLDWQ